MEWSWTVFVVALPIAIIVSMFSHGAMNSHNIDRFGGSADYRSNSGMAFFGSLIGGSVWAAIITAIIGFF